MYKFPCFLFKNTKCFFLLIFFCIIKNIRMKNHIKSLHEIFFLDSILSCNKIGIRTSHKIYISKIMWLSIFLNCLSSNSWKHWNITRISWSRNIYKIHYFIKLSLLKNHKFQSMELILTLFLIKTNIQNL